MSVATIDIFCGIGGLSYGLLEAGLSVVAGVDVDESCRFAYEHNVQAPFVARDICDLHGEDLERYWPDGSIRVLAGCAPCQPFSALASKVRNRTQSKRRVLLREFGRLIEETNPEIVAAENVPGLARQQMFGDFVSSLEQSGYHVWHSIVYCADYGVPQTRRRLVLLASKLGKIALFPGTHSKDNYVTVQQTIGHLPPVEAGEVCESDAFHRSLKLSPLNLRRIQASRPGGTWRDWEESLRLPCHQRYSGRKYTGVYGRMEWDKPAPTITTKFVEYGTGRFGHPAQNRALTLREGALLQTFPQDYQFCENEGNISLKALSIHIGNAVPVRLAVAIGRSILKHVQDHGPSSTGRGGSTIGDAVSQPGTGLRGAR